MLQKVHGLAVEKHRPFFMKQLGFGLFFHSLLIFETVY